MRSLGIASLLIGLLYFRAMGKTTPRKNGFNWLGGPCACPEDCGENFEYVKFVREHLEAVHGITGDTLKGKIAELRTAHFGERGRTLQKRVKCVPCGKKFHLQGRFLEHKCLRGKTEGIARHILAQLETSPDLTQCNLCEGCLADTADSHLCGVHGILCGVHGITHVEATETVAKFLPKSVAVNLSDDELKLVLSDSSDGE